MQLLDIAIAKENFSTPFIVPEDERASALDEAFAVAMSHPVPLTADFKRGFTGILANLTPCQIVALLFSDITVLRYALVGIGNAKNGEEKGFIVQTAWRGYLQSLYACWMSFTVGIRCRISKSETGTTLLSLTTNPDLADYEDASAEIAAIGDFFTETLTKHGEVVDPVFSMSATINNAFQTLAIIEQSCFFSHTHCSDSDTKETKEYFLSMAKAAFLVRSTAMDWLLKGIKDFKKTNPLNKAMKVSPDGLDKTALRSLQGNVLQSLWMLSLGLMSFQYLVKAQVLFSPNTRTNWTEHKQGHKP